MYILFLIIIINVNNDKKLSILHYYCFILLFCILKCLYLYIDVFFFYMKRYVYILDGSII